MQPYKNLDGNSGVSDYQIGEDRITVRFTDGNEYLYTYTSAGSINIEKMKELAISGRGLNGFINTTVKKKYVHF
jgi:hypothetical protein